jgi:5-methylcytosine-specific restriction endonuclease McrA
LDGLSDERLLAGLGALVREDDERTADLLVYIDEVDRRHLWARRGHPSLFDFLVRRFHMSEAVAYRRIRAARTARRFPVLFGMVARSELHLSGIHELSSHLTAENHGKVLAEAKHMTLRDIERLVARIAPKPDVPARVRELPRRRRPTGASESGPLLALLDAGAAPADRSVVPSSDPTPPRSSDPTPLAPRRYKLEVTMGEETNRAFERLQGLLAHQIPNGDPAAIVALAFDALIERTLKRKAAVTDKPRAVESEKLTSSRSRAIPAHVKRAVWERDGGQCGFVGEDGRRCTDTRCLEFGHIEPWAKGGQHTVANVGLRCRAHNAYEAIRDYGPLFLAEKRGEPRSVREAFTKYARSG